MYKTVHQRSSLNPTGQQHRSKIRWHSLATFGRTMLPQDLLWSLMWRPWPRIHRRNSLHFVVGAVSLRRCAFSSRHLKHSTQAKHELSFPSVASRVPYFRKPRSGQGVRPTCRRLGVSDQTAPPSKTIMDGNLVSETQPDSPGFAVGHLASPTRPMRNDRLAMIIDRIRKKITSIHMVFTQWIIGIWLR
jgi:hypothetical protein